MTLLVLAALVVCVVAAAAIVVGRPRQRRKQVRHAPPHLMMPDHPEADWSQASVPRSALAIRCREEDGSVVDYMIQPKSIRGPKVGNKRVRPKVVNATCGSLPGLRAFPVECIISAMDARSGEFIDDLYTYLGSAQPGGAPSPSYRRQPDGAGPS